MPGVAHRVVEEARACAAQTARDANQYLDDVVEPYFKEVDEEVDKLVEELQTELGDAFAKLSSTQQKTGKANRFGTLEELRKTFAEKCMSGGGDVSVPVPCSDGKKKGKKTITVQGKKLPELFDHPPPPEYREAYRELSNELIAQGKDPLPEISIPEHVRNPKWLPQEIRHTYRLTPRKAWYRMSRRARSHLQ